MRNVSFVDWRTNSSSTSQNEIEHNRLQKELVERGKSTQYFRVAYQAPHCTGQGWPSHFHTRYDHGSDAGPTINLSSAVQDR